MSQVGVTIREARVFVLAGCLSPGMSRASGRDMSPRSCSWRSWCFFPAPALSGNLIPSSYCITSMSMDMNSVLHKLSTQTRAISRNTLPDQWRICFGLDFGHTKCQPCISR
jgi:hypothetical protein